MDVDTRTPLYVPPAPSVRGPNGWLIATIALAVVLVLVAGFAIMRIGSANSDLADARASIAAATVKSESLAAQLKKTTADLENANAELDSANGRTAACQEASRQLKLVGDDLATALATLSRQAARYPGGYLYTSYIRSVLSGINIDAIRPAVQAARTCAAGAVSSL